MRPPDFENAAGTKVWALGMNPKWPAGIGSWIVTSPLGVLSPMFTHWYLGCVALRDFPGLPPSKRHYPEAEYEFSSWTMDPAKIKDVDVIEAYEERGRLGPGEGGRLKGHLLQPPDIVYQWHGTSDAGALIVVEALVRAVLAGNSLDRPPFMNELALAALAFDAAWRQALDATVEHIRSGAHGARRN